MELYGVYVQNSLVPELFINPGCLKMCSVIAMTMYYGPEVLYKNNLISNIMNFNEN